MYDILRPEITTDPLGRGYSGMNDAAVATSLNASNRTRNRGVIPAWEIAGAIVWAEYTATAVTANARTYLQTLVSAGSVNIADADVRLALETVFGAATASRANLIALRTETVSRARELGMERPVETIDVTRARQA